MSEKHITAWELINPSDKITFTGDDFKLVVIAVCLVGDGAYGGKEIQGTRSTPFFLFGGVDEWFIENYGSNFEDTFKSSDKEQLANILDSFTLGNYADFIDFNNKTKDMDAIKLKEFKEAWNDKRSSMNNICARAWEISDYLRKDTKTLISEHEVN